MPIYDYKCKGCNHKFEILCVHYSDAVKVIECPQCKEIKAEKQMSTFTTQGLDHNVGFTSSNSKT